MYFREIFHAASAILGNEDEKLRTFCHAAEQELAARLQTGVTQEQCGELFVAAAALLAVSMYEAVAECGGTGFSYQAGDVSVTAKETGMNLSVSRNLRKQAETMMAPYLQDDGFQFTGVRG